MAKKKKKEKTSEKEKEVITASEESTDIFDEADCDGLRIEVARQKDEEDEWEYFWLLYAKNGKPVATAAVANKRLNDLKETVQSIAEIIDDAPLIRLY